MLDTLIKKNIQENYNTSLAINQIKSDAERGDFFRVYFSLEQGLQYFSNEEMKDAKTIGNKGIEDSLRIAMIDAQRGLVSSMNTYLSLASKYSILFNEDISKELETIMELGNKNKLPDNNDKIPRKTNCMIRIAGYADL
ncbi:MAG: hypothetical protein PHN56_01515 [Candidatus Nanoarchaeia archaeon]|nr:hypothetical protein [Candidatus Nanoarchaeia archaeon]